MTFAIIPKFFLLKCAVFLKSFLPNSAVFLKCWMSLSSYNIHKTLWQSDILYSDCTSEQWCDFAVLESRDAATDSRNEEGEFGVLFGKFDELIDVWLDGFDTALHCRYGV